MINRIFVCTATFKNVTHPCALIGVLSDVWGGAVINMLTDMLVVGMFVNGELAVV